MGDRQRWLSEDGKRLAAKVFWRLQWGRSLDGLGLPTVGGRIDLRGFTLPDALTRPPHAAVMIGAPWRLPGLRKPWLRGVDLSGSRLPRLKLYGVHFEDCDLRGADLTNFGAWRSRFERCDLSGADLTDATLSSWERGTGNAWRNCSFNAARLDGILAKGAEFQGCDFEDVKIANVVLSGCSFVDCRITGLLDGVSFYGRNLPRGAKPVRMENFDLRDCRVSRVAFIGLRLSGVRLPRQDSVTVLPGARGQLARIRSALAGRSDEQPHLSFLVDYLLKHVEADDDLYLDYDEIREGGGESSVAFLREIISPAA